MWVPDLNLLRQQPPSSVCTLQGPCKLSYAEASRWAWVACQMTCKYTDQSSPRLPSEWHNHKQPHTHIPNTQLVWNLGVTRWHITRITHMLGPLFHGGELELFSLWLGAMRSRAHGHLVQRTDPSLEKSSSHQQLWLCRHPAQQITSAKALATLWHPHQPLSKGLATPLRPQSLWAPFWHYLS